ncbi:MAG TPA: putative glycoside hydrolase, partial [Longimicrobium sp.]|nr:putative glycoside hydrolase [Longimicrobium sp.]
MDIRIKIARLAPWTLLAALPLMAACGGDAGKTAEAGKAPGDTAAGAATPAAKPGPVGNANVREKAPEFIRGLYLNAYAAGSRTRLPKLLQMADQTEINAFVVDVKDEKGIRYKTTIPLAAELAQDGEVAIRDLKGLIDTL